MRLHQTPSSWVRNTANGHCSLSHTQAYSGYSPQGHLQSHLQKKVPLGDKKPLHCHIKKLISLLLGLIIFLIVFFAPSVARTVCGFVENLFGLLYSKRIVGFMLTLNHLAIKGCTSGSPSIPLSQPALNHNRGCRYDFSLDFSSPRGHLTHYEAQPPFTCLPLCFYKQRTLSCCIPIQPSSISSVGQETVWS